jgi:LAO/AO transport system kinase
MSPEELAEQIAAGNVRAVARACRLVDDHAPEARELLRLLHPHSQAAWTIGVTGSPGAGKSTLVDRLIERFRAEKKRVGVVAVDPTSPFSGGAILGDRVRMQRHFEDAEVFIRSLATRGALGGLSRSAADVVGVLAAWGADVVLLETVGVGQDELEVTEVCDTTLVVVSPGLGDDVQALKAGILEVADVFAVNKADHAGADATVRDLEAMQALGDATLSAHDGHVRFRPAIVRTVATTNQGIEDLVRALEAHRDAALQHGEAKRQQRAATTLRRLITQALTERAFSELGTAVEEAERRIVEGTSDPYSECDALVRRLSIPRS